MVTDGINHLTELLRSLKETKFWDEIEIKRFFGGSAAYYKEIIFITFTKVGIGIKLTNIDLNELREFGGKELKYFEKGHVKKQYLLMPQDIVQDKGRFTEWVSKSIKSIENKELK